VPGRWSARRDRKAIDGYRTSGTHLVLAVHRRDVESFRALATVRMLGAGIEVKRAHLVAAQGTARDHALDRFFEHALGEAALEDLGRGRGLDAAGIAGVAVI